MLFFVKTHIENFLFAACNQIGGAQKSAHTALLAIECITNKLLDEICHSEKSFSGRCRTRNPSSTLPLPRHPNQTSGLLNKIDNNHRFAGKRFIARYALPPHHPHHRWRTQISASRSLQTAEACVERRRGGGPHTLCDTNILMWHKSDTFCDKQAAVDVGTLCCVVSPICAANVSICATNLSQQRGNTARAGKAPRDRHSSDSFWLIWSYQKKHVIVTDVLTHHENRLN